MKKSLLSCALFIVFLAHTMNREHEQQFLFYIYTTETNKLSFTCSTPIPSDPCQKNRTYFKALMAYRHNAECFEFYQSVEATDVIIENFSTLFGNKNFIVAMDMNTEFSKRWLQNFIEKTTRETKQPKQSDATLIN